MTYIPDIFKAFRKILSNAIAVIYTPIAKVSLFLNGAKFDSGLNVKGLINLHVTRRGILKIGKNCTINSGNFNLIGRQQKAIFWVEGKLSIGKNLGLSCSAIICNHEISIGDNVKIGGNTVIYDTDFHSLDPTIRVSKTMDKASAKWGKVSIGNQVFIGAHTTILKGVIIGDNSVIGACSVVTKNIPSNEIWGGNPAKYIAKIN
jgi:acetyltransferase-like isoleucine patch superfamily enzyme